MENKAKPEKHNKTKLADNEFILKNPIKRGDTTITTLKVNEPNAGSLRGVSLSDIIELQVDAIIKIAPRVITPLITQDEVNSFCGPDLMAYGLKLASVMSPAAGNDLTPTQ